MASGYDRSQTDASSHMRLENRLVLLGWLHSLLEYDSTDELLSDIKDTSGDFGPDGQSNIYHKLISRNISDGFREKLKEYDENIRKYLERLNVGRTEHITLKYFQYLAVLYAEIFLDHYFNRHDELLVLLNSRVDHLNGCSPPNTPPHRKFVKDDLKKLAFWMATASGKTHVMHINYQQFLHYQNKPPDNILLVTPNERLSAQHLEELGVSGIPAGRLDHARSGLETDWRRVQIIEITKISIEKSGGGESIPIEALEGNNLVFVDEGHKGSGGDEWRGVRETLGKAGFTFEYSATFKQALAAAKNNMLVEEYGRAIAFDYSYPHFHGDGYGKDFDILNLNQETYEHQLDMLLMANLLSFYEQRLIFDEREDELRRYNLARPLWMFVGSKVNATYMESGKRQSDVLIIIRFLHRLLSDKKWATGLLSHLLMGKSGLEDKNGVDILKGRFWYLRDNGTEAAGVYHDILKRVFHTDSVGGLCLCNIRGADGELGLKAAGSRHYFGLVCVGDKSDFIKLVESEDSCIVLEQDVISKSLFARTNDSESTVEILVGAKKFMEGWNSWRVSSMGLLNVGRSEGAQIIQLFGRGVRLRGKGMSLKRSSKLDGSHPDCIRPLETLNIFAMRADYMDTFRKHLTEEGVHGTVEFQLPIWPNRHLLGRGLVVPRLQEGDIFAENADVELDVECAVKVHVDLGPRVNRMVSESGGIMEVSTVSPRGQSIPEGSMALIHMQDIYVALLRSKEGHKWYNMVIRPDAPAKILRSGKYEIAAKRSILEPHSWADMQYLQKAATAVVLKYAERFYRIQQERWESGRLRYQTLDQNDPNFQNYGVTVQGDEKDLARDVQQMVEECNRAYKETDVIPNIHFDRHLYQPLLCEPEGRIKISPPGLNKGEREFVENLKVYCADQRSGALAGMDIFLLRNLSRGKGVGFFQTRGFYPDFILWIKSGDAQDIVFVEPHGMFWDEHPDYSDKVSLHDRLLDLTKRLGTSDITLDSYIVSQTPYMQLAQRYGSEWSRQRFAEHHILFPDTDERYGCVAGIIREVVQRKTGQTRG